jgi:hypothetical protein
MSTQSIGRGPASGGNENHSGDPTATTMGEKIKQEPPAGAEVAGDVVEDAAAPAPGVTGDAAHEASATGASQA